MSTSSSVFSMLRFGSTSTTPGVSSSTSSSPRLLLYPLHRRPGRPQRTSACCQSPSTTTPSRRALAMGTGLFDCFPIAVLRPRAVRLCSTHVSSPFRSPPPPRFHLFLASTLLIHSPILVSAMFARAGSAWRPPAFLLVRLHRKQACIWCFASTQ
jgi:hypothetical protein